MTPTGDPRETPPGTSAAAPLLPRSRLGVFCGVRAWGQDWGTGRTESRQSAPHQKKRRTGKIQPAVRSVQQVGPSPKNNLPSFDMSVLACREEGIVDQAGQHRAQDGSSPEQPQLRQVVSPQQQGGAGAPGRVDRQVGDRTADQVNEGQAQADGNARESVAPRIMIRKKKVSTTSARKQACRLYFPGERSP